MAKQLVAAIQEGFVILKMGFKKDAKKKWFKARKRGVIYHLKDVRAQKFPRSDFC